MRRLAGVGLLGVAITFWIPLVSWSLGRSELWSFDRLFVTFFIGMFCLCGALVLMVDR